MPVSRRSVILAATALPLLTAVPVFADAVAKVSLWDKPEMDMAVGLGHGLGGMWTTIAVN
jgi:Spy/CpxP family protein refolding chaperone